MSKICAICGKPLDGGVVVHNECVPKWISVMDGRPESEAKEYFESTGDYLEVIVMIAGAIFPTTLCTDGVDFFEIDDEGEPKYYAGISFAKVTHWMLLPEPPKEADNVN